jgi:quinol monooxygenase YgiN
MYGTIAKLTLDPAKIEEFKAYGRRTFKVPGQVSVQVFQSDGNPGELYLVVTFESREAYWANANSPEQAERYQEMRALLSADPEWHDGEVVTTM